MSLFSLFGGNTTTKRTTSQTLTNTFSNSLQGVDGITTIVNGSNNTLTDHGAVEKALDTTQHIFDEAAELVKIGNGRALHFAEKASQNALHFASNVSKPSDERTTESIIKYAGIALIGVIVTTAFKKATK